MTRKLPGRTVLIGLAVVLSLVAVLLWRATKTQAPLQTDGPQILYLTYDARDRFQLYVTDLDGRTHRSLTEAEEGVLDYAVSPDGQTIVYSARTPGGGANLWTVTADGSASQFLLDCRGDLCSGASWAPGGRRLVYERRRVEDPVSPPGSPRLWWLDLDERETTLVFQDTQLFGHTARFSADGNWLAFVVPVLQQVRVVRLESGETRLLSSATGEAPVWHPEALRLLTSDIDFYGEAFATYLFAVSLPDGVLTNLSGDINTNDASPAWSPDGAWIAFGRKVPRAPTGRQLWLMDAEGNEQRPLTRDPDSNFGPPAWSTDGRWILTQRFQISEPGAEAAVYRLDVESGELLEIASPGFQPRWLP